MKTGGKRKGPLILCLLLLGTALQAGTLQASDEELSRVTFFYTGWIDGNFGPCGCTTTPSGGFSRRAAYARDYSRSHDAHVLHVDLGGLFLPLGPHAATVNQEFLKALEQLPLEVVHLSPADLFLWDEIAASRVWDRFISTNLTPFDSSRRVPRRYRIVEVPGTRGRPLRLGFVGLSSPRTVRPNSGFRGEDPVQAFEKIKDTVLEKADLLVVLTDIPQRPDQDFHTSLAQAHPEVGVILASEKVYMLHDPVVVNQAVILSSVERGRHLGKLELGVDTRGRVQEAKPEWIQLDENVPDDPHFLSVQETIEGLLPH